MPVTLLLADALRDAAVRHDGGVAAIAGARTITWTELDAYASALAVALERRGVAAGDRVAMLTDGIDALITFWAITKASAVGVVLDTTDTGELADALREVSARALVIDAGLAPSFHHAVARSPDVRAVIVRGRTSDDDAGTAVYVAWDTAIAEEEDPTAAATERVDLDDAWIERETGGSTRALSHRVLISRASSVARGLDLGAADDVSGTAFAETAVACALSGACFRAWPSDAVATEARTATRSLFIHAADEEATPPTGSTPIALHRHPACGPIAVLSTGGENEPTRILPNVDIRILDDKGGVAPCKVVGEITVRTSSLVGAAPVIAGYFRTGDSGMLDDSGALYVL